MRILPSFRLERIAAGAVAAVLLTFSQPASRAQAQAQARSVREEARRATAARADLESLAAQLEQAASAPGVPAADARARLAEAATLRERLRVGDFADGDRIALRINDPPFSDTLQVRTGQVLVVPNVGEISLAGALRAELNTRVNTELRRFMRSVQATATAVTRVGFFGPVLRQGFYQFPSDMLLSQAIMQAGGPASNADIGSMRIFRGDRPAWNPAEVKVAIQEGMSLEQLGIRGGDEIRLDEKSEFSMQTIFTLVGVALQVVNLAVLVSRR